MLPSTFFAVVLQKYYSQFQMINNVNKSLVVFRETLNLQSKF